MAQANEYKNKFPHDGESDSSESGGDDTSGTGGQSGHIEFKEFITNEALRDDLLSEDKRRQYLGTHDRITEGVIKKQKGTRDRYQQLKEGKLSLDKYRQEKGMSASSSYPPHPSLSNQAQFSGADPEVNSLPDRYEADTNNENRNELEYRYNLVNRPQNVPRPETPRLIKK